jgi:hypothetical protein
MVSIGCYLPGRRANAGHCLRLDTVTGKVHPIPAGPQVSSIALASRATHVGDTRYLEAMFRRAAPLRHGGGRREREPLMPTMRIASPERWWRASAAPLAAGLVGWAVAGSVHLGVRATTSAGLPLTTKIIVICSAVAIGLWLATRIMHTHLAVSEEGLADHRLFRVVRVRWPLIANFEINRPRALWGGFCITVVCRDGMTIDLMSTRAYSRVPSARHLDELHRICWTLEQAAAQRAE